MQKIVDCDEYWWRPAIFSISRNFGISRQESCERIKFPEFVHLYDMINISGNYYSAIDQVVLKSKEIVAGCSIPELQGSDERSHVLLVFGMEMHYMSKLIEALPSDEGDQINDFIVSQYGESLVAMKDFVRREVAIDQFKNSVLFYDVCTLRRFLVSLDENILFDRVLKMEMVNAFCKFCDDENGFFERILVVDGVMDADWPLFRRDFLERLRRRIMKAAHDPDEVEPFVELFTNLFETMCGEGHLLFFDFGRLSGFLRGSPYGA